MRAKKIVVPDLVGLKIEVAQKVLLNSGFRGGKIIFSQSYEPSDTVISQEPLKGMLVDQNTEIKLMISKKNYTCYLPTLYQKENAFLHNFLWIFQCILESITKKIDNLHFIFYPWTVPEEFIPWLGMWLGIVFEPDMSLEKRRNIIKNASKLYAIRGTSRSLKTWMNLIVGMEPEIIENQWPYKGFRIGVSSSIGVDSIILPPMNLAHCFIVKMPIRFDEINEETLIRIHKIIQNEKPAHTNYFLQFKDEKGVSEYRGFLWIGITSRIGEGGEELPPSHEILKKPLTKGGESNESGKSF